MDINIIDMTGLDPKRLEFLAIHFSTEEGKRALEYMRDIFAEQNITDPTLNASFAFYRGGERNVVKFLENNIIEHNNERT